MNTELNLGKNQSRRLVFVALVSLLILMLLGSTSAGAQFSFTEDLESSEVFTGCVNQNSGGLRSVAIGLEPAKECGDGEFQITWDRADSAFGSRIAALEERVVELEGQFGTLDLFVDCDAGDTIGAALADADTHVGQVNITISGVCEETVVVKRDDVSFVGIQRSDGIRGPSTESPVVALIFADRVEFSNMTFSGGNSGLFVFGASFGASNVTIRDSLNSGIDALHGAVGSIHDCSILGHATFGVHVNSESVLDIRNCEITDNGEIGLFAGGVGSATILVQDSYVARSETGIGANPGGNVRISGCVIEQNLHSGVMAYGGEIVLHGGETHIADNGQGIQYGNGASGYIYNAIIENNASQGISLSGGSNITAYNAIVRNNGADGILVRDLSTIAIHVRDGDMEIINNGGWGINCEGPPAIAVLGGQGLFNPAEIVFSGNVLGDTTCQ